GKAGPGAPYRGARRAWRSSLQRSRRELEERVLELDLLRLEAGDAGPRAQQRLDHKVVPVPPALRVAVAVGQVDGQCVARAVLIHSRDAAVGLERRLDLRGRGAPGL